jgi:hypothetical protein
VLTRNHLVAPRRPRRPTAGKRFERELPNDLWQIDGTQVALAAGERVWVVDVLDDHARYLLAALAATSLSREPAWACFVVAAAQHGLPRQLLSDNGSYFTGRLLGFEADFERRLAVDVRGRTDKVKRSETAAPPRRRVRRRVDHGLDTGNSRDGASPVPRSPCTHSTSVLVPGRRASKTHPMTLVLQQRDDRTAPDVRCLQSRESSFPTSCRRVPTSVL